MLGGSGPPPASPPARMSDTSQGGPADSVASPAPGSAGLIGQVIAGRYRIEKKLGGGGMGEVYLAQHVRLKRKSAVKVLRASLADDDEALARFNNEAQNASMISHPNVAQVYDFGEDGNLLYLAMEFIEGQSMQEVLEQDGVMHPDMVADVIMQSASALDAAHAQQVLHRDVKPDNIMLARNPDGTYLVKLVDFGIARALASTDKRVTQTGMVVGTPEFMSPEQIAGEELDARSDLYSLALVAFVALTGEGAFPDTGSMESLILRLTSRPKTLIEARQSVKWPPRLQTVFDRALAPMRDERQASAVEFATELSDSVVTMSPSETSAFYRRALEVRNVNPVALTPKPTPAKSSDERKRTVAATAAAPAPVNSPRAGGLPPRQTSVSYAGPTASGSRAWRYIGIALVAGAVYVAATGKTDEVLAQARVWATPAFDLVEAAKRRFGGQAATPVPPTVAPKPAKPRATPKKADSLTTPATPGATPPSPTPPDTASAFG